MKNIIFLCLNLFVEVIKAVLYFLPLYCAYNIYLISHFAKNASKEGCQSPKEIKHRYIDLIHEAENYCLSDGVALHILTLQYENKPNKINANSTIPGVILVKPKWIEAVQNKNKSWKIAFLQTVGHELAHKINEPLPARGKTAQAQFTNWVRECRADFWGVDFVLRHIPTTKRQEVLEAINLKAKVYTESGDNPDIYTHPYWSVRCALLAKYPRFNRDVVEELADYAHFKDTEYIDQIALKAINF